LEKSILESNKIISQQTLKKTKKKLQLNPQSIPFGLQLNPESIPFGEK